MKYLLFLLLMAPLTFLSAQNFRGLDKSPMDKAWYPVSYRVSDKVAAITYSRPQLKGRNFADIVPSGKIWRTGANEATELRVFKPIAIGDTKIPVGTYTVFTIFEAESMTFIVNSVTNSWGAYSYNQENDVVRLRVPVTNAEEVLEAFSMTFTSDETPQLHMGWATLRATIPFTEL